MPPLGTIRVLIILATSADERAAAPALESAFHSAFGADAVVAIRTFAGETDADLANEAELSHATLVTVIRDADGGDGIAVRFLRAKEGQWADRAIRFGKSDPTTERLRTVGFTLAAMVPEQQSRVVSRLDHPEPAELPSPVLAPLAHVSKNTAGEGTELSRRSSVEVMGHGALALGGSGGGLGGSIAARFSLSPAVALRIGGGARVAELAAAQATSRTYLGAVGIAWTRTVGPSRRWMVGGRIDALALGHEVVHLSQDDPEPVHQFRLLPGVDAAIEAALRVADHSAMVLAVGSEAAFGKTDVLVHRRRAAELVPIRIFVDAGLRVAF